ncbi:MAG: hypothetical protein ACK4V6_11540 [Microthrixaceae bacterium]
MRIVRVEQVAPGGGAVEVHPRLTVLRGSTPELRRRLRAAFESLSGRSAPQEQVLVEVNGVRLQLDAATLAQLELDQGIEPVLELGGRSDHVVDPDPSDTGRGARDRLREVTSARTDLGARMETARAGLDSFSTAALDVCVGQIDALEARRSSLRVDFERRRAVLDERRHELQSQLDGVGDLQERVAAIDADAVRRVRNAVVAATEQPAEPDTTALDLADRLDAALGQVRDLVVRRASLHIRESEAAQRLDEAAAEARSAERSMRAPQFDQSVVRRLEAVRDEIFAVDDRASRLGATRNKRRLAELRSEEAVLLDRLGFDTYSAYVMGIPSVRAELERSSRVESARDRADRIAEEIDNIRRELPVPAEIDRAAQRLHQLLEEALDYLGAAWQPRTAADLISGIAEGDDATDLVYETVAALRRRRVQLDDLGADALPALRDELVALIDASLRGHSSPPSGPVQLPALAEVPFVQVPATAEPSELVGMADLWLDWHASLARWCVDAGPSVVELQQRLVELDVATDEDAITRWAEVEAELDVALDRLAEAQERVRRHEDASEELARLREEELELRDRERRLLEEVAAEDAAAARSAEADRGPTARRSSLGVDGPMSASSGVEWDVISRLARQRSVSFVGSIPALVLQLPDDPDDRANVLVRLDRLSDKVQVLVVSDDTAVVDWARGLDGRGAVVELQRHV